MNRVQAAIFEIENEILHCVSDDTSTYYLLKCVTSEVEGIAYYDGWYNLIEAMSLMPHLGSIGDLIDKDPSNPVKLMRGDDVVNDEPIDDVHMCFLYWLTRIARWGDGHEIATFHFESMQERMTSEDAHIEGNTAYEKIKWLIKPFEDVVIVDDVGNASSLLRFISYDSRRDLVEIAIDNQLGFEDGE